MTEERWVLAFQGKALEDMTRHELTEALGLVGLWARQLATPGDNNWLATVGVLNAALHWQAAVTGKETRMTDKTPLDAKELKWMPRGKLIRLIEEFRRLSKLYYPPILALVEKSLE